MTKIIIKQANEEEIISTSLAPEEIKKLIKEYEEEKKAKKALEKMFGILKTKKSLDEIREELYEEI
ncbi:hypothetical protein SAMN06265182_1915 [Persephonella hydrogeniphila]|uniref:Uncharacterized protein n=1 Tax=Persephonella hydrogeniphila TaxID=198703 RepID=A0A285NNW9_9AQUI|nr:hypothetical protein [Persephonella hydrogeniphila]SNZ10657.1 hypothetical protein SAMN06265182_1915 [Persephonella hydrogeniphila]